MNKENSNASRFEEPLVRVTRARAKSLGISGGGVLPPRPWQDQKRVLREKSKRAEMDENRASAAATASFQHKRRAVLKDVTNASSENPNANNYGASKHQATGKDPAKRSAKLARSMSEIISPIQDDPKTKLAEELSKIKVAESEEFNESILSEEDEQLPHSGQDDDFVEHVGHQSSAKKEEDMVCEKSVSSNDPDIIDIDTNLKDPQACCLYAPDIYNNIRITELERRPSCNYMQEMQRDISPHMRAVLIDWLVEVSEEYNLVPDTLYLTVNLIDRFLSHNHIEKQRLQLLGVTCMLIASKYEEICAPRAEEFCFITDNTYTRGEVLKMESEILNLVHFHLSAPTTKTFIRRFIQAAQSSYEAPSVELEFLANYLAELTLVDYKFLKFLPSLVAASAVFLARWTLSQSDHPWNCTLEHYTGYKASELENAVLAMADMQANNNGYPGNAVREKYRQPKFKSVATLTSAQPVRLLFR